MDAAADEHVGVRAGGGPGEAQGIPGEVRYVLHLGDLIVVGQDDGLPLGPQATDLLADVGRNRHPLPPRASFRYYATGIAAEGQGPMSSEEPRVIPHEVRRLIENALEEDGVQGDITTDALVFDGEGGRAAAAGRAEGGLAGAWGVAAALPPGPPPPGRAG